MPPLRTSSPESLEAICLSQINHHLIRELHLCYQIRRYEDSSLLLRRRGICSEELQTELAGYLKKLPPLLDETVRQQLLNTLMIKYPPKRPKFVRNNQSDIEPASLVVDHRLVIEMLTVLLNDTIRSFSFYHKSFRADSSIWDLILTRCKGLTCFKLVPGMFTMLDSVTYIYPFLTQLSVNCPMLTELILKDAISGQEPLAAIGKNCHHLRRLDLSGSQVDCRDIFSLCVTSAQDNLLKQFNEFYLGLGICVTSAQDNLLTQFNEFYLGLGICVTSAQDNLLTQFNEFYLGLDDRMSVRQTDCYPLCQTMEALVLCDTNVRSQGVGLVLRLMPNLQTLGTLVYTAAGLKNLYNFVRTKRCSPLKLTEVFYRGPSHIKLKLLARCCPLLEVLSLGSEPARRIKDQSSFTPFMNMHTLMLENIHPHDIKLALRLTPNLRKLELDCVNVDISVVATHCPKLRCLVVRKEPLRDHSPLPSDAFDDLELIQISSPVSIMIAGLFFMRCKKIKVIEMVRVRDLNDQIFCTWLKTNPLARLEVLILRFVPLTRVSVDLLINTCPNLVKLGEIGGWDVRSWECRRIKEAISIRNYDLAIIMYTSNPASILEVFNDALSTTEFSDSGGEDPIPINNWI